MKMNDRELLELAAKAAGIDAFSFVEHVKDYDSTHCGAQALQIGSSSHETWNPLTDDGDALRLAVNLGIHIEQNTAFKRACALWYGKSVLREELFVSWGDDKYAATRRAIVRAAAEIGRQMQEGGAA